MLILTNTDRFWQIFFSNNQNTIIRQVERCFGMFASNVAISQCLFVSELDNKQYGNFAWNQLLFTVLWKINRMKISFLRFPQIYWCKIKLIEMIFVNFLSLKYVMQMYNNENLLWKKSKRKKMYPSNGKFIHY